MDDLISRQAAIDAIDDANDSLVEDDYTYGVQSGMEKAKYVIEALPSAEPEIKPIEYRDCANAMMKMWMDNVVTDGEYSRIMDKLNAHWRKNNG